MVLWLAGTGTVLRTPSLSWVAAAVEIVARTGASVSRQSILTLNPGQWLNDEIITYVSRVIINQGRQRVHSYSSHFFDRLIGPDEDHPQYDFAAVANWSMGGVAMHPLPSLVDDYSRYIGYDLVVEPVARV